METEQDIRLQEALEAFITPNKLRLIEQALEHRTRHLVVALENIHKPHNASAVLRTIECLGIQEYFIIESQKQYRVSPHVAKGAAKWVDIHRFNVQKGEDTQSCIEVLRQRGYKIACTSPRPEGIPLEEVPVEEKLAVFFGNELYGLSETVMEEADLHIHVPMWGFTESYNLSVSASIVFYQLLSRLRGSKIPWQLSAEEKAELRMQWYRKIVTRAEVIEKQVLKN
ncbi:TrmH family RNA methyltransferase [Nafulsella turpanensis]|uniref:TrmH family RNA methyltransferase n=1 Tax=Nafulsella turpanensis TaxID=1265690 RepID=UPI00034DC4C7|nr:RNA methyltransferase [Nafulsella turpanensis]